MDLTMAEVALGALRVATGAFFACSGYNKLFNKGRHEALVSTLERDHVPVVKVMQWWVPFCEFTGGLTLASGLFTNAAAFVLGVIMAVAIKAEGKSRVKAYKPINEVDSMCDWLYLPETVYGLVLAYFVVA